MSFSGQEFVNFGWPQPYRKDKHDEFHISFSRSPTPPMSFKQECYRTAKKIYESTDLKINVLMSGGIDSEVVCRSFFDQKIPFDVTIFQFEGQDLYDIHFAVNFCKYHGIDFKIESFNQFEFVKDKFWDITDQIKAPEAFVAFDIERWQRAHGFPVFGNGDVHLEHKDGKFCSLEIGAYSLPWAWQNLTDQPGCYRFFKSRPELIAAYLAHPYLQHWKDLAPKMNFEDSRWWKMWIFKEAWPDILSRPKRTGYEIINKIYSGLNSECQKRYSYKTSAIRIPEYKLLEQVEKAHGNHSAEI